MIEPIKRTVGQRGQLLGRDSPSGLCFVLPVLCLATKRDVEFIFKAQYSRMFADADFGAAMSDKLVTQLNIMIMNTFDPDCAYASFGALDSSIEAQKKWRRLHVLQMKLGLSPATRMLSREFRTTPMVLLLMNSDGKDPGNPLTRKFLQKSTSDSILSQAAGVPMVDRFPDDRVGPRASVSSLRSSARSTRPYLDDNRRTELYRTARKRFKSCGGEIATPTKSASPK